MSLKLPKDRTKMKTKEMRSRTMLCAVLCFHLVFQPQENGYPPTCMDRMHMLLSTSIPENFQYTLMLLKAQGHNNSHWRFSHEILIQTSLANMPGLIPAVELKSELALVSKLRNPHPPTHLAPAAPARGVLPADDPCELRGRGRPVPRRSGVAADAPSGAAPHGAA